MACYHPLEGYRKIGGGITFKSRGSPTLKPIPIPCGQCVGCRLERSRQWAIRCHHEASLHQDNCFITLTYNQEYLPADGSLNLRDLQLFMKRLRKKYVHKIRFYACGEYGDHQGRPHFHACLFGHDFADKRVWQKARGEILYRSAELEELWPYGYCSIGSVTFQSAAYVARYIMKKITGKHAQEHYQGRKPEFTVMSRRPGVGALWLEKYASDVYPEDFVIINGKRMRPPRYYDQNFELIEPETMAKIKKTRIRNSRKHADNNTPTRLSVRETIAHNKLGLLPRTHDKEDN